MESVHVVSAIILAAGMSKRMGRPKMLLPWGTGTVIQSVIASFQGAGVRDILVVTGASREAVEDLVGESARTIFNPDYERGEMLTSIQVGLAAQQRESAAAFVGLGDQPQIEERTIRDLLQAFANDGSSIIVPSYDRRRGHPWLVARAHWDEILRMGSSETMRQFLNQHSREIRYVESKDSSVLADLDTPDDYMKFQR